MRASYIRRLYATSWTASRSRGRCTRCAAKRTKGSWNGFIARCCVERLANGGVGSRFRVTRFPCGPRAPSGGPIEFRSALGFHTIVSRKRLPTPLLLLCMATSIDKKLSSALSKRKMRTVSGTALAAGSRSHRRLEPCRSLIALQRFCLDNAIAGCLSTSTPSRSRPAASVSSHSNRSAAFSVPAAAAECDRRFAGFSSCSRR